MSSLSSFRLSRCHSIPGWKDEGDSGISGVCRILVWLGASARGGAGLGEGDEDFNETALSDDLSLCTYTLFRVTKVSI